MRTEILFGAKQIRAVGIARVAVYGKLAGYHVGDKQHEHERDTQACHVDERKELVALQKCKVSFKCFHTSFRFNRVSRILVGVSPALYSYG